MFFGAAFTRMSSDLERMTAEELTSEIRRLKREIDQLRNDAASNKTSAERLQEAMDSSTDMVVLYDKDERIVFTNDRYHEIYPKSPPKGEIVNYSQEQLLRRSLEAGLIDHPLARKDPDAWVQLRLQQRRHAVGTVTETPHTNGRIYQIRHRRTKDGGYLIVQSDITDQKRVEDCIEGAAKHLNCWPVTPRLQMSWPVWLRPRKQHAQGSLGRSIPLIQHQGSPAYCLGQPCPKLWPRCPCSRQISMSVCSTTD